SRRRGDATASPRERECVYENKKGARPKPTPFAVGSTDQQQALKSKSPRPRASSAKSRSCHRAKSARSLFVLTLGQEGLEGCELHSQLLDCMCGRVYGF